MAGPTLTCWVGWPLTRRLNQVPETDALRYPARNLVHGATIYHLLTNWIRTNQATCPLVDREWVSRPPHYSPPKINSISSEYILSFHLSSPMHSQYYSPNHGY